MQTTCSSLVHAFARRLAKALECFATLASAIAGASLHLAENSASLGAGNTCVRNTPQVASRAWIMLLRPFVQIATGVLWSMSVWLVVGEDGEDGEN
eukprot:COSAG02_NODE_39619_length_415_cov_0.632911_1_plen_95_part_01